MKSLPVWFSELEQLVATVSQELRRDYANRDSFKVSQKKDTSPVTEVDLKANEMLVTGLRRMMPGVPVVSEEDLASHQIAATRDTYWLVDPLDGTFEFLEGTGEFTINIALIKGGELELGLVGVPMLERLYYGGRQYGAYVNGQAIAARAVQRELTAVGSRRGPFQGQWQERLEAQGYVVDNREAGAALKFCLIAEGHADLYPRPEGIMQWDTAAAHAVLHGVGGNVVDWSGNELRYGGDSLTVPPFLAAADPAVIKVLTED